MGIWPWQCTPTGLDDSTELRMEKIRQAVTEIWVPQVWQPPAQPPARPPGPWRQYPSSPEGWGVKTWWYRWDTIFSLPKFMTASAGYIFTYFDYWKPDGETHGQPAFTKTCWHSDFGQRKNANVGIFPQNGRCSLRSFCEGWSAVIKWLLIFRIFQSINFNISRLPSLLVEKVTNFGVWTNITYQGHQIWQRKMWASLIWRVVTQRWNIHVPVIQISPNDLTLRASGKSQ